MKSGLAFLALMGVGVVIGLLTNRSPAPDQRGVASLRETPDQQRVGSASNPAAGTRLPVPPPLRGGTDRQSIEPEEPAYEPERLLEQEGWTILELFESEPRNPEFAEPREEFFASRIESLVMARFPDASVKKLECRTSTCALEIEVDSASAEDLQAFLRRFVWGRAWSPRVTGGDSGLTSISLSIFFDEISRDHSWFSAKFAEIADKRRVLDDEFWAKGEKGREPK
jgi:hypothetical protein